RLYQRRAQVFSAGELVDGQSVAAVDLVGAFRGDLLDERHGGAHVGAAVHLAERGTELEPAVAAVVEQLVDRLGLGLGVGCRAARARARWPATRAGLVGERGGRDPGQ